MANIEKRIAALEQTSPQAAKVIFIILVGVGEVGNEIIHIYNNDGKEWNRLPGETEKAFRDRATSETTQAENQVTMLFGQTSIMGDCIDMI
jgi:hypothetical protein